MEIDVVLQLVTHRHLGRQVVDRLDEDQIRRLVAIHGNGKILGLLVATCKYLEWKRSSCSFLSGELKLPLEEQGFLVDNLKVLVEPYCKWLVMSCFWLFGGHRDRC